MMDIHILLAVDISFPLVGVLYLIHHLCGVLLWLR